MRGGTGVWWGELQAVAGDGASPVSFRAVRSLGFEPDVCAITTLESAWRAIAPKLPPGLYLGLPSGDQEPPRREDLRREDEGEAAPVLAQLPARGDLVLAQERSSLGVGEDVKEVRLKDLFLRELRPLDEFSPRLVELVLADVRSYWQTHGEITRRWNVRGRGDRLDQRWNPGGAPTPLREIFAVLCAALPGAPGLVRCPDVEAVLVIPPPQIECWGANPAEVLQALCEALGLVFSLDLGGTASIYWRGEGTIGDHGSVPAPTGENDNPHDPPEQVETGAWAKAIRESRVSRRVPAAVPDEVLVVGGPSVWTVAIDYLEPVIPVQVLDPDTGQEARKWVEVTPAAIGQLLGVKELSAGEQRRTLSRERTATGRADGSVVVGGAGGAVFSNAVPLAAAAGSEADAPPPPPPAGSVSVEWLLNLPLANDPDADEITITQIVQFARDTHQIIPGEEPIVHPAAPVGLNEGLASLLKRSLLKYWRVGRAFRHLLPILPRAERAPNGKRLPVTLEAFSWAEKEVTAEAALKSIELQQQAEKRRAWQSKRAELAEARARLLQVKDLTAAELVEWWAGITAGDFHLYGSDPSRYLGPLEQIAGGDPIQAMREGTQEGTLVGPGGSVLTGASAARTANGFAVLLTAPVAAATRYVMRGPVHDKAFVVQTARGNVDGAQVVNSLFRWGKNWAAQKLGLGSGKDAIGEEAAQLQERITRLEAKVFELQKEWDVAGALREEMVRIQLQIRASEAAKLVEDTTLREKLRKLQIEYDEQAEKERVAPKSRTFLQPVNLPRARVEGKVVDDAEGVFELEEAAFWLADLAAPIGAGLAIPMPVRATFGSRHEPPHPAGTFDAPDEDEVMNELVRRSFDALAKEPQLARFAASTGHVMPEGAGGSQARWGFRAEGGKAVPAEVSPHAYLVAAPDLRLEVGLGGASNEQAITRLARAYAEAAMGLPAFRGTQTRQAGPQVLEGGHVVVEGPRAVNPNGRISSVEWTLGEGGAGIDTRVNLDAPFDPLSPTPSAGLLGRPLVFRFGLDPSTLDDK